MYSFNFLLYISFLYFLFLSSFFISSLFWEEEERRGRDSPYSSLSKGEGGIRRWRKKED